MKNIVKVADPAQLLAMARNGGRSSSPASLRAGKSPPIKRKTFAGCPFELCVRTS
ncbi:hypothetical protein [Paenibacillus eucommiae]|uniref:Uncharacterized protein n=1 Tax=Paenibacillus eucommiae TaxID=1355755 RepID=A0ABS4IUT2_9BACL|nr:hypothetical protein [Paenibacillus eucommiae]MBP1990329.1 hypothetical protein [Paenibacillus eucommiae]